jgi:hypothetical protein
MEALEEDGARFEEAADHALHLPGSEQLRLGPSLPVPLGDLEPGYLAWYRSLWWGCAPDAPPIPPESPSATLYFAVAPAHAKGSPKADQSPLRGTKLGAFACVVRSAGPPPVLLAVLARQDGNIDLLERFLNEVREELEAPDE